MPKYTSITEIENYLLIDIDLGFQSQVEEWISSVEALIESITGRIFVADAVASEKKYELKEQEVIDIGRYTSIPMSLIIDECAGTGVTKLVIDDGEITASAYLLYPANKDPKTRIQLKEDSGVVFTKGEQNILVTAHWGYSVECPAEIKFAATVLTAGIIQNQMSKQEIGGAEISSFSLGPMSVSYREGKQITDFDTAKDILEKYKKI